MPADEWEKAGSKVKLTKDMGQALNEADLVIEAIPENLELKRNAWAKIDSLAPQGAILATNSSSIPSAGLKAPPGGRRNA